MLLSGFLRFLIQHLSDVILPQTPTLNFYNQDTKWIPQHSTHVHRLGKINIQLPAPQPIWVCILIDPTTKRVWAINCFFLFSKGPLLPPHGFQRSPRQPGLGLQIDARVTQKKEITRIYKKTLGGLGHPGRLTCQLELDVGRWSILQKVGRWWLSPSSSGPVDSPPDQTVAHSGNSRSDPAATETPSSLRGLPAPQRSPDKRGPSLEPLR